MYICIHCSHHQKVRDSFVLENSVEVRFLDTALLLNNLNLTQVVQIPKDAGDP